MKKVDNFLYYALTIILIMFYIVSIIVYVEYLDPNWIDQPVEVYEDGLIGLMSYQKAEIVTNCYIMIVIIFFIIKLVLKAIKLSEENYDKKRILKILIKYIIITPIASYLSLTIGIARIPGLLILCIVTIIIFATILIIKDKRKYYYIDMFIYIFVSYWSILGYLRLSLIN